MPETETEIRFGPFRLDLADERLWHGDAPVSLSNKALTLLAFLADRADRLVTKRELLDAVWPDTYVSDAVIKVAVAELRRALGESAQSPRFIQTVHRRGYRFIVDARCGVGPPTGFDGASSWPDLDAARERLGG